MAAAAYRDVQVTTRVLSSTGPALTAILYGELADALRVALRPSQLAAAATRALTMIAELDAALPATDNAFTGQMRSIHGHAARQLGLALAQNDPKRCQAALDAIAPIADAWEQVRSSA